MVLPETNRYAREKIEKMLPLKEHSQWQSWSDVTLIEMKAFWGVLMNMALNEKPSIDDYFSGDKLSKQDFFSELFTRKRFRQLYSALHLAPPAPPNETQLQTRSQKVRNVVEHIDSKCRELFSPGQKVAVDESTIAFKGRVGFLMYNPQKPTKWGLRGYVGADSETGYIWAIAPYFGNVTTQALDRPDLPFASRIVLHLFGLLQRDCPADGRHFFTDRFYTSLASADELRKERTHLTGTIMANRKGLPVEISKLFY